MEKDKFNQNNKSKIKTKTTGQEHESLSKLHCNNKVNQNKKRRPEKK